MPIKEYMRKNYRMEIIEDPVDGGYTISFPELPGCLTCGENLNEALANAQDAKKCWFQAALEDGYPIPEPYKKGAPI